MKTHKIIPTEELKPGYTWVYYVDGYLRYVGKVKFHLFSDCRYLVHHKPAKFESDVILQTSYRTETLNDTLSICKTCLKRR